jgi:CheY-like chemotaxis protein
MKNILDVSESTQHSPSLLVLLVEDSLMNQRLAGFMMNHLGIAFDVCSNGAAALKMVVKKKYGLILMDIEMPKLDGLHAAKEIRRTLKMTVPIVALTAYDSAEEVLKFEEAGMNDHLIKPLDQQAFIKVINKYLSLTQLP